MMTPVSQLYTKDYVVCFSYSHILVQSFRFMVGPGHCPIISKHGPSLSKAMGPVDPSILGVKKSHYYKIIHLTVRLRTP